MVVIPAQFASPSKIPIFIYLQVNELDAEATKLAIRSKEVIRTGHVQHLM